MKRKLSFLALAAAAWAAATVSASAHAMLDHAVPAVGGIVKVSPAALDLTFNHSVSPAFSSAKVTGEDGAAAPTGKASVDASGHVLHVPIGGTLKPGTYTVEWRAVSSDTHAMTGRYTFTVAP